MKKIQNKARLLKVQKVNKVLQSVNKTEKEFSNLQEKKIILISPNQSQLIKTS